MLPIAKGPDAKTDAACKLLLIKPGATAGVKRVTQARWLFAWRRPWVALGDDVFGNIEDTGIEFIGYRCRVGAVAASEEEVRATANIQIAAKLWLESAAKLGDAIPEPDVVASKLTGVKNWLNISGLARATGIIGTRSLRSSFVAPRSPRKRHKRS